MKHKGLTPAIYASPRIARIIHPGQDIPRNAKFVIAHTDLDALAWALDKSTLGNRDETREPDSNGHHTYTQNVEAVLQRVVSTKIEKVSLDEFQLLRHTLGASGLSITSPDLGWRNGFVISHFCGPDGKVVKALIARGLMKEFGKGLYRVTERGKALAGAP